MGCTARGPEGRLGILRQLAGRLYGQPGILGFPSEPDDALDDWALQKTKPATVLALRKHQARRDAFYQELLDICLSGHLAGQDLVLPRTVRRLSPAILKKMAAVGIIQVPPDARPAADRQTADTICLTCPEFPGALPGLRFLAGLCSMDKQPVLRFSRGWFSTTSRLALGVFSRLQPDPAILAGMADWFDRHAYDYQELRDGRLVLDWSRDHGRKPQPLKDAWATRTHSGISLSWEPFRYNQVAIGLRLPEYKTMLAGFSRMDPALQDFLLSRTKACDGCRFCVQTDKTGTRPLAAVTVQPHAGWSAQEAAATSSAGTSSGASRRLCPLFPGFGFVWRTLDKPLADQICAWSGHVDQVLSGQ